MLFVVADPIALDVGPIWLVPSREFAALSPLRGDGKHKFSASAKPETQDMWSPYLVDKQNLPARLIAALEAAG